MLQSNILKRVRWVAVPKFCHTFLPTRRCYSVARFEFENKVVFVTGGSRGIGKAIANVFAQDGASVVVTSKTLQSSAIDDLANQLPKPLETKQQHMGIQCDISDSKQVDDCVSQIISRLGKVDVLVNSAGIAIDSLLIRMSDSQMKETIDTNLMGPIYACRAVLKHMLKQRINGSIINIGSIIGEVGNSGQAIYSATKAALVGLTKSLAKEVGSRGIRVNLVAPGLIDSDMTRRMSDQQKEKILSQTILNRLGNAEEVANVVHFLASSKASYITGQTIFVDGGKM